MGNPRSANGHRRRQLIARVKARDVNCWLCGKHIDKNLGMMPGKHGRKCPGGCNGCIPHPMRAEVHEIIPVSRGGSPYDPNNCTLTHRKCNNWISDRTPTELANAKKPTTEPVVTAIAW